MKKNYINTNVYLALDDINPPADLKNKILKSIETAIERKNKNRKIIGFSVFSVSIISFIGFAVNLFNALELSGFSAYLSLIFSDSKLVLGNFGEFALSLVDSLPFFAITITLVSMLVIFISIRYATNSKKELSYSFNN